MYWSGWNTLSWLLGLQILLFAIYVPFMHRGADAARAALARDVRASLWLIGFYVLMIAVSWLGTFGGKGRSSLRPGIPRWPRLAALAVYGWGARSGLPEPALPATADED